MSSMVFPSPITFACHMTGGCFEGKHLYRSDENASVTTVDTTVVHHCTVLAETGLGRSVFTAISAARHHRQQNGHGHGFNVIHEISRKSMDVEQDIIPNGNSPDTLRRRYTVRCNMQRRYK